MRQHILFALQFPESEAEEKSSKILNPGNFQFIQNQLALEMQRRINLEVDPTNYMAFVQQEAEIKGAMRAFQFLLDCHNDTITALAQESQPQ